MGTIWATTLVIFNFNCPTFSFFFYISLLSSTGKHRRCSSRGVGQAPAPVEGCKRSWGRSLECDCWYTLASRTAAVAAECIRRGLLSVREPCQIRPVQHGQSLLNWLREIQNSLSAECTDRAAETRHCETNLRKGFFFFFPPRVPRGEREFGGGKKIECNRNYQFHPSSNAAWALIPSGHQQRVRRANTLTKFTTAWLWLLCLSQRVWRGSTWFALNHSPSGCHSLCKRPSLAAPSCLSCKFHVGRVHTSGLAWRCRWPRINTIKRERREKKKGWSRNKRRGNHCGKSRSLHPIYFGKQVSVGAPRISWGSCQATSYLLFRSQVETKLNKW